MDRPNIVEIGSDMPISCIIAIEDEIWVACGDTIYIIPVDENEFQVNLVEMKFCKSLASYMNIFLFIFISACHIYFIASTGICLSTLSMISADLNLCMYVVILHSIYIYIYDNNVHVIDLGFFANSF